MMRDYTPHAQRTHRQILRYIAEFRDLHDCGPALRDLVDYTDVSSTSVANYYLAQLREQGLVTWSERPYRRRVQRVLGSLNLTAAGRREIGDGDDRPH